MAASIGIAESPDDIDCAVCFVVGATGCGKSAIAVKLCQLINGEIINADAVQLYQGLDIASARIPLHERGGVPHHLLGCFSPHEPLTVREYVRLAIQKVKDIAKRGKIPVITGGTNYYIEKILFYDNTDSPDLDPTKQNKSISEQQSLVPCETKLKSPSSFARHSDPVIESCIATLCDSQGSLTESASLVQIQGENIFFNRTLWI